MKNKLLHPRAVHLLRLAKKSILAQPKAYDQGHYGNSLQPDCGSPACLIGWMLFHATRYWPKEKRKELHRDYNHYARNEGHRNPFAMKVLHLTEEQFELLYWSSKWPEHLQASGFNKLTTKQASDRIDLFIKTDGLA